MKTNSKIIDATDLKLGRLASYVAKQALEGTEITIVNAENSVIIGRKENILETYSEKRDKGSRYKGPFYPKRPDRILKRVIRGMLPYKKTLGRQAFKRIKVYIGIPEELEGKELETIKNAKVGNIEKKSYLKLAELSKALGGRW